MKFYVFSGNEELLDSLRNRFPSDIEFSNDFNRLQALQAEQEWNHIIVIHDENHPLGNIRPSADLPPWQHVEPGKYLGDVFIDWHDGALFAPAEVQQEIKRMQEVESICKQINEGLLSVRFDYSVFGGGRDADRCLLDIQKDGKAVGSISLGNDDTVSLWLDGGVRYMNEGMNERTNIIAFNEIESIVDFALKRDDTELVDALPLQGEVNLPYGAFYRDWSREDILNEEYANMMNGCMDAPDTDDIDI